MISFFSIVIYFPSACIIDLTIYRTQLWLPSFNRWSFSFSSRRWWRHRAVSAF